jgi:hypothetical protein
MGPTILAQVGRNISAKTQPKPTMTPTNASGGNVAVSGSFVVAAIQPAVAVVSSSAKRTAVAVIVPLTLIMPGRHGLIGPSVTGTPAGPDGGAQTSPPRLGGFGAAQPARASSSFLSFRIGLATSGCSLLFDRVSLRNAHQRTGVPWSLQRHLDAGSSGPAGGRGGIGAGDGATWPIATSDRARGPRRSRLAALTSSVS